MNWKFWQKETDVVKVGGRKWLLAIFGVVLLVVGWLIVGLYTENRDNMLLGILTIISWGGGLYLIYAGLKPGEHKVRFKKADKELEAKANTVNICVKEKQDTNELRPFKIEFVYEENPTGTLIEITNLRKYFYFNSVHYNDKNEVIKTEAWSLPDGEYLSPRKYIIPLTMQAYDRYIKYKRSKSMFQKISAGIMLAAFAITTFFFWLTMVG